MKVLLNILLLLQTSHHLTTTSAQNTGRVPHDLSTHCTERCPVATEYQTWMNDTCDPDHIGICGCTYLPDPYCTLQCYNEVWSLVCQRRVAPPTEGNDIITNQSFQVGSICGCTYLPDPYCTLQCYNEVWSLVCQRRLPPTGPPTRPPTEVNDIGTNQSFQVGSLGDDTQATVTTPDDTASEAQITQRPLTCADRCPTQIPDLQNGAQCNVAEINSCICTTTDPSCSLECAENFPYGGGTGTWMMACMDMSYAPENDVDSENTSNVGEFGEFTTPLQCTDLCPTVMPNWRNMEVCDVIEIDNCRCTYPEEPNCFLNCIDGIWAYACAGGGGAQVPDSSGNSDTTTDSENTTNVGEFGEYTTPLHCTDLCPTVIPDWENEAECNVTEIDDCSCTYSNEPNCFLNCVDDNTGTWSWSMACAGGGGAQVPDSSGNSDTTTDSENTSNVGEVGEFTTSATCADRCPTEIPDWENRAECNVTEIDDCSCTYEDPNCFLNCVDKSNGTGSWSMACAGGGGGLPDSSDIPSVAPIDTNTGTRDSPSSSLSLDVHTTFW
eukprot:CAMPEP_0198275656 /NCGR_PEP_ID=MMETSP1447-20131203/64890_1 /TAXON_ID=420782 /ORGANISM="Chaetoceros dichaeta, Strain CCMP1751" /LENGTH=550 /DNA_ID=CAMNT_0043970543 /DNA_START=33 /DNA_END=1682 /DNA_ORIENTATION=-